MHTIFFHDKPFILCPQDALSADTSPTGSSLVRLENPDPASLESLIETARGEVPGYLLITPDEDLLFGALQRIYRPVEAAGGIVTNPEGAVLVMFRRRRWDLPKGKIEETETPESAALREVTEETGLSHIRLGEKLIRTWHGYEMQGEKLLKETHWFRIAFTGTELTVPQIEEDITDIQWISPENLSKYMPYSYPNLIPVFRAAGYQV